MELKQLSEMMDKMYGLSVSNIRKSTVGAGSDTYFLSGTDGDFVLKYPSTSEMNHPEMEPELCEYLLQQNIPVCQFLKNKHCSYLSKDEQGRTFHLQRFLQGTMYEWNTAPDWFMTDSARLLGKIHTALASYQGLPEGIGAGFFLHMTPKNALKCYEHTMTIALSNKDEAIIKDLTFRINLMKRFTDMKISIDQLTRCSTHGDYFISQMLCGTDRINAIIDWTTACIHPVVWEIMRSFAYADPGCGQGIVDAQRLVEYVQHYLEYAALTEYDISMLAKVYYYQIAVCDYYGQYYASTAANRSIYLDQAVLSTKLMRWFDGNIEELTEYLSAHLISR